MLCPHDAYAKELIQKVEKTPGMSSLCVPSSFGSPTTGCFSLPLHILNWETTEKRPQEGKRSGPRGSGSPRLRGTPRTHPGPGTRSPRHDPGPQGSSCPRTATHTHPRASSAPPTPDPAHGASRAPHTNTRVPGPLTHTRSPHSRPLTRRLPAPHAPRPSPRASAPTKPRQASLPPATSRLPHTEPSPARATGGRGSRAGAPRAGQGGRDPGAARRSSPSESSSSSSASCSRTSRGSEETPAATGSAMADGGEGGGTDGSCRGLGAAPAQRRGLRIAGAAGAAATSAMVSAAPPSRDGAVRPPRRHRAPPSGPAAPPLASHPPPVPPPVPPHTHTAEPFPPRSASPPPAAVQNGALLTGRAAQSPLRRTSSPPRSPQEEPPLPALPAPRAASLRCLGGRHRGEGTPSRGRSPLLQGRTPPHAAPDRAPHQQRFVCPVSQSLPQTRLLRGGRGGSDRAGAPAAPRTTQHRGRIGGKNPKIGGSGEQLIFTEVLMPRTMENQPLQPHTSNTGQVGTWVV